MQLFVNCIIIRFIIVSFFVLSFAHSHYLTLMLLKMFPLALAGVAQWIECRPVNHRVPSSIPSQGRSLGGRPGPQQGAHERQPCIDVSLPLFLPPFLSL